MIRKKIQVRGRVQGVYFRASAMDVAIENGISGFIRNMPDGSVYAEAEGDEEAVNMFIRWCGKGPYGAKVEEILAEDASLQHSVTFEIRR